MIREEIFGREESQTKKVGKKGCGYLGKVVSYPAGRYEESGAVYLDLTSPHCMLVVGKRGTGKSYTLGVLAEGFGTLDDPIREKIAVLVLDTMSVFHSLKSPNTNSMEVAKLGDFNGMAPKNFGEYVKVFLPRLTVDTIESEGKKLSYDGILELPLSDITIHDWLSFLNLNPTDPTGVLLARVFDGLLREGNVFDYNEIYSRIANEHADEDVKRSLINLIKMVENLKIFGKTGYDLNSIVKGGQISVLDISYLGRIAGFDVRNLILSVIARKLLSERTLYTTLEMQAQANLIDGLNQENVTEDHPLVYMIIDEAHLFLPADRKTLSSEILIDWIKLGRHPGLSLIMATQEPSALHETAIRQSDILLAHNVTANDDIAALGKAKQSFMSGSKDIQKIVSTMEFKKGLAVLFDDKTRKIEMIKVRPRMTLHAGMDASALKEEESG
jgi:DNA helicase HerA-like ATPase